MFNCPIKQIRQITAVLVLLLLLLLSPRPAVAQSGFLTVAPARQQISVDPGESATITVQFINQGNIPISGDVGVADFIVADNIGSVTFVDDASGLSSKFSAASWISLPITYQKITLPASDEATISMTLKVPRDARPGGRYFGIYFEPTSSVPSPTTAEREAGSEIQTRLAGLVYVRVNGPIEEKANIIKFKAPAFIEYGPVKVTTEIINRGSYHITPKGQITLYDMLGRRIDQKSLDEVNIFPDAIRAYTTELGKQLLIGKFNLKLDLTYGESGQALTATASFWAFPVRIVLIIILTVIILLLLGMLIWKKLKGRQSKLEEKLEEEIKELEQLKDKVADNLPTSKK